VGKEKIMSNVLPIQAKPTSMISFTAEQVETIKKTVTKGATEEEFNMFAYLCQKYALDPFLKEIWFFKRPKKEEQANGKWDYPRLSDGSIDYSKAETIIMTSRDGYLKVAQQNPEYIGPPISFVVCEGDEFEINAAEYKVTHKFGAKRGQKLGAWAKMERKGKTPAICFVPFAEYNNGSNVWAKNPSAMIQKVAEVFVLKRQFGISGLVTQEEIETEVDYTSVIEPKTTDIPVAAKKTVINITPEATAKKEVKEDNNPSLVKEIQEPIQKLSEQVEPIQSDSTQKQGSEAEQNQAETKVKPLGTREFTLLGAKMQPIAENKTLWILAVDLGDGRKTMIYLDPAKADEFENLGVGEGDKMKVKIAQSGNTIIAQEVEVVK
jgi:phage recombination protein Bet